jgi:hypothetical protein
MPEGQKAEATAKHSRKEEGPKRASFTGPVKANGRTAKRCQAPTAKDKEMPEGQKAEAKAQHRQVPVTRKKMPEHQKAEATTQPRRKNEGPKRASVTRSGERRGRMPK